MTGQISIKLKCHTENKFWVLARILLFKIFMNICPGISFHLFPIVTKVRLFIYTFHLFMEYSVLKLGGLRLQ